MKVLQRSHHWRIKDPLTGEYEHIPRDGRWQFNGDFERPTFTPSVNMSWGGPGNPCGDGVTIIPFFRNHFTVTDGRITYCTDCTHALSGQTLDLLEFTEIEMVAGKA